MKLRCIARYENNARGLIYEAGEVFAVEETLARFLLADAPGCFLEERLMVPIATAPIAPPADKMQRPRGRRV